MSLSRELRGEDAIDEESARHDSLLVPVNADAELDVMEETSPVEEGEGRNFFGIGGNGKELDR